MKARTKMFGRTCKQLLLMVRRTVTTPTDKSVGFLGYTQTL